MSAKAMSEFALRESAQARLEKYSHYVPFTSCVIWAGAANEHGYGVMGVGKKCHMKAHRVAYALAHGLPLRKDGTHSSVIKHACDNPACVNVDHLTMGTQLENLEDTKNRNRLKFGSKHHSAKLSEEDVIHILAIKGQETQTKIAKRYGISPSIVSRIYGGRAWTRAAKGDIS